MRRRSLFSLLLWAAIQLSGCTAVRFDVPGASNEAAYAADHPLYAEYCALSQIRKKPGFGADIRGEIGGHAVFYLNGACKEDAAAYPVLRLCRPGEGDGVGLSMNAHFRNAKWVATPGRDFFFAGGLPPGTPLTRQRYQSVRTEAQRRGIYDGVPLQRLGVRRQAPRLGRRRPGATRSRSPPTTPSPSAAAATAPASPSTRCR